MRNNRLLILSFIALLPLAGCGGNSDNNGLEINRAEAVRRLRKVGEETGYSIEFDMCDGEEDYHVLAAMKGDTCWSIRDYSEGIALKHQGDYYHSFIYNGEYHYAVSYRDDAFDNIFSRSSWLFMAHDLKGVQYKKGAATTVLGRACTYYTFRYALPLDDEYDYRVAIDDEYGITLGIECLDLGADEDDVISFKARKFELSSSIVAPRLPEVENIIDANDQPDTAISLPNKIHIDIKCGDEDTRFYKTIEICGDAFVIIERYSLDIDGVCYYAEEDDDGVYEFRRKDLDDEFDDWEDFDPTLGDDDVLTMYDAFCYMHVQDIFDMGLLYHSSKVGPEIIGGNPATHYHVDDYELYLSDQYRMFLKMVSIGDGANPGWNREITSFRSIDALSINPYIL